MSSEPSTQSSLPEWTVIIWSQPWYLPAQGLLATQEVGAAPASSSTLLCSGNAAQAWILLLSYKWSQWPTDTVLPPNPANTGQSTSFPHVPLPREITPCVSWILLYLSLEHADFHKNYVDPLPKKKILKVALYSFTLLTFKKTICISSQVFI